MTGYVLSYQYANALSTDELDRVRATFSKLDIDGDGKVNRIELSSILKRLGEKTTSADIASFYNDLERDQSGAVDFNEFVGFLQKLRSGKTTASTNGEQYCDVLQKVDSLQTLKGAGGAQHSYCEEEKVAFTVHINHCLQKDSLVANKLPIDANTMEIFQKCSDGLILCKLINLASADEIDERAINTKPSLNVYEKTENLNLAINAAKAIGCRVTNIGSNDLLEGRPILVMGIMWQIIKIQLLSGINLRNHPELLRLLREEEGETVEQFANLSPEELLLRWFNFHLEAAKSDRRVRNFGKDLVDSECYATLLHQLSPLLCPMSFDPSEAEEEYVPTPALEKEAEKEAGTEAEAEAEAGEAAATATATTEGRSSTSSSDNGNKSGTDTNTDSNSNSTNGLRVLEARALALHHTLACAPPGQPLSSLAPTDRARLVLRNARRLGVYTFIKPRDVVSGNRKLNLGLVAQIFNCCHGLDRISSEELSNIDGFADLEGMGDDGDGDLSGGGSGSREERMFRMWINSLNLNLDGIDGIGGSGSGGLYIQNLFTAMASGVSLLQIMDGVEPKTVAWQRVNKRPSNRWQRLENCNYAVSLGQTMGLVLINIGGTDIHDGKKNLVLAVIWQLMRRYTIRMLERLSREVMQEKDKDKDKEGAKGKGKGKSDASESSSESSSDKDSEGGGGGRHHDRVMSPHNRKSIALKSMTELQELLELAAEEEEEKEYENKDKEGDGAGAGAGGSEETMAGLIRVSQQNDDDGSSYDDGTNIDCVGAFATTCTSTNTNTSTGTGTGTGAGTGTTSGCGSTRGSEGFSIKTMRAAGTGTRVGRVGGGMSAIASGSPPPPISTDTNRNTKWKHQQQGGKGQGQGLSDNDIIRWANRRVEKANRKRLTPRPKPSPSSSSPSAAHSRKLSSAPSPSPYRYRPLTSMQSFKDPTLSTAHFLIDLIAAIEPRCVNYDLVTDGYEFEEKLQNAKYAISCARKIGAAVFLCPEDLVEVRSKMVMTMVASLWARDLELKAQRR